MFQSVPIASGPATGHHQEPGSILFAPSLQLFMHIDEIPPAFSSPGGTVPALRHRRDAPVSSSFHGPLLESLQCTHLSCTGEPRAGPSTPGVASPLLSRGKGSPLSAGSALPNAAQGTIHLLCCKGTLLPHGQFGVYWDLQVPFCRAAFQLGSPQHVLVHGVVPSQMQDLALHLVEPHEGSCQHVSPACGGPSGCH